MDGRFVPDITLGPVVVKAVRRATRKPLNVHLMVREADRHVAAFAAAGADHLLVHGELSATFHLHRVLMQIRALGRKAGVVLDVDPGFAGQSFLPGMLPKIRTLRSPCERQGLSRTSRWMAGRTASMLGNRSRRGRRHRRRNSGLRPRRLCGGDRGPARRRMMDRLEAEVAADAEQLAERAAAWFAEIVQASTGRVAVALSGGSTPRRLYRRLAGLDLPWQRLHWFWGDERFVAPDDPLSNYRMTREALFDHAPVPAANIHRVPTVDLEPETAAERYESVLRDFYGEQRLRAERPLFDVVLLGLGTDGHTASLFPGTAVLEERQVWVAPVLGAKEEPRITLTYPALESSRHVAFLVAGADKRRMLGRLLAGDGEIPAGRLATPRARFFADRAATGR